MVADAEKNRQPSLVLLAILLLTIAAFWNVAASGFVYDDRHQVLENPLVQHLELLPRALTSDVWAFKGSTGVWSNYWRPGFTLWSAVNWQVPNWCRRGSRGCSCLASDHL